MNKCKEHYNEVSGKVWDLLTYFVDTTEQAEKDFMLKVTVETLKLSVILDKANDGFDFNEDVNDDFENKVYDLREELASIVGDTASFIGMLQAELNKAQTSPDRRIQLWTRIASRLGDIEVAMTEDYDDSKSCREYRRRIEGAYFNVFKVDVEDR